MQAEAPVGNQDLQPGEILHREAPASTSAQSCPNIIPQKAPFSGTHLACHRLCGRFAHDVIVVLDSQQGPPPEASHTEASIVGQFLRRALRFWLAASVQEV